MTKRANMEYNALWRRIFGVGSSRAELVVGALLDRASSSFDECRSGFRLVRDALRSASDLSFDASSQVFAPWRKLRPRFFDDPPFGNETAEVLLFVLQTYVAQTILSVFERYYDLRPEETDALIGGENSRTPFDWGAFARTRFPVERSVLTELRFDDYLAQNDPFAETYSKFFPNSLRQLLGEFYTPGPVAEYLYRRALDYSDVAAPSCLDPACGAGVFLTTVVRNALERGADPTDALERAQGRDISPLAVVTARANLLAAATSNVEPKLRPERLRKIAEERKGRAAAPIYLYDSVKDEANGGCDARRYFDFDRVDWAEFRTTRFDVVLGNPPWIAWDKLAPDYRASVADLWKRYGLFDLSGKEARYGGGKKELAALVTYAAIDRSLRANGLLAFVLPKPLFQKGKAAEGFRRFGEKTNEPFRVLELDDFSDLDLFKHVTSRASGVVARKGEPTRYPIPLRVWFRRAENARKSDRLDADAELFSAKFDAEVQLGTARPSLSAPGAPLKFELAENSPGPTRDLLTERQSYLAATLLRGDEPRERYRAQLGANAAGASGVFWLEAASDPDSDPSTTLVRNLYASGKRVVGSVETRLETALLFPLTRWRDVDEYCVKTPTTLLLCPQDPEKRRGFDPDIMAERYPLALEYLERFKNVLSERAAYKRYQSRAPYWSLYNVDVKTFAPYKVVWRRMDLVMRAAALAPDEKGRPIVPQDTLSLVPVESPIEADYLCAALNSVPVRELLNSVCAPGAKSFGSPSALDALNIPKYDPESEICRELAEIGRFRREEAQKAQTTKEKQNENTAQTSQTARRP